MFEHTSAVFTKVGISGVQSRDASFKSPQGLIIPPFHILGVNQDCKKTNKSCHSLFPRHSKSADTLSVCTCGRQVVWPGWVWRHKVYKPHYCCWTIQGPPTSMPVRHRSKVHVLKRDPMVLRGVSCFSNQLSGCTRLSTPQLFNMLQ